MLNLNLIDLSSVIFDTNTNQTCYNFTFQSELSASLITFGFPADFRLIHPIINENIPGSMSWSNGLKFDYLGSQNSQNYVICFQGNTSLQIQNILNVEIKTGNFTPQSYILNVPKCQIIGVPPILSSLVDVNIVRVVWDEVRNTTRCYFIIRLLEDLDISNITLGFPISLINSIVFNDNEMLEWITQSSKFNGIKLNEIFDFSQGSQIRSLCFNGNVTSSLKDYVTIQVVSGQEVQITNCQIPEYDLIRSIDIPIVLILKKIVYNKINDTTNYYFFIEILGTPDISSIIFGFPLELQNSYIDDNFEGTHEWIISGSSFKGINFLEGFTQQKEEIERYISFNGRVNDSFKTIPIKVRSGSNTEIYELNTPELQVIEDDLAASIIIQKVIYDNGLNQTHFYFQITSKGKTDIENILFGFPLTLSLLAVNHNFNSYGEWIKFGYIVSEKFDQENPRERFICFQGNAFPEILQYGISVKVKGGHSCIKQILALPKHEEIFNNEPVKVNIFINRVLIDKQKNETRYYFIIQSLGESQITSLILQFPITQFPTDNNFSGGLKRVQDGFQINENFDQIAKQRYICFQGDVTSLVGSKLLVQAFNMSVYQTHTVDIPLLDLISKKCECRTYSMGYWKNHQLQWPSGTIEKTLCNKKWLEIMETSPERNNKWTIMAKQWITTQLNVLHCNHPECIPEKVNTAIEDLGDILIAHCDPDLETGKIRQKAYQLKDILEYYNQGKIGPGKDEHEEEPNSKNSCEVIVNLSNNGTQDILDKLQELVEHPKLLETYDDKLLILNNKLDQVLQEIPKFRLNYDELLVELFQCVLYRVRNKRVIIPVDLGSPKVIKLPPNASDFRIFPQIAYHVYQNMIIIDEPTNEDFSLHLDITDGTVQVCYL